MSRRVANARRRGTARREQRRKGFVTTRHVSRARSSPLGARRRPRAREEGCAARVAGRQGDASGPRRRQISNASRATSAWAEEAAEARRRRVAVRRCVSRRDRRATARAFYAWVARTAPRGSDGDGGSDVSSRDVAAVATGVVLRVAASRGRAHAAAWVLADAFERARRDSKGDSSVVRVHRRGSGTRRGGDDDDGEKPPSRRRRSPRSMQRPTLALAHRRDRRCAKPPRVRGAFERVRGVGEARARHADVARAPRRRCENAGAAPGRGRLSTRGSDAS